MRGRLCQARVAGAIVGLSLAIATPDAVDAQNRYATWNLVDGRPLVVQGQQGTRHFAVTAPQIQADGRTGRVVYMIAPHSNPGCGQRFVVEWAFQRDMSRIHEGETYSLSACVGVGACGHGAEKLQKCFAEALTGLTIAQNNTVYFKVPGPSLGAGSQYHEGGGYNLIRVSHDNTPPAITPGQRGGWRLTVYDSPQSTGIGSYDTRYGNFALQVGMSGIFTDLYAFRYDAGDHAAPLPQGGQVWHVSESGWAGVWTQRGTSNTFDAVWTQGGGRVTAVLTITRDGDQVRVERRQSSDGNDCNYQGTLSANGTVEGWYSCSKAAGPFPWHGTVG